MNDDVLNTLSDMTRWGMLPDLEELDDIICVVAEDIGTWDPESAAADDLNDLRARLVELYEHLDAAYVLQDHVYDNVQAILRNGLDR